MNNAGLIRVGSLYILPMNCNPAGKLPLVKPIGTVKAGCPV